MQAPFHRTRSGRDSETRAARRKSDRPLAWQNARSAYFYAESVLRRITHKGSWRVLFVGF
jgi:hypothetical protein